MRVEPITGEFVEAKLWQGNPGILIATHTFFPSVTWIDEWYQLSPVEAQSITDWSDLYVSLVVESTSQTGELRITQVYLEATHGAFSSVPCPPGVPEDEPCGIKLIPYREPVYPHRRRMAGLLKGGRIAVCVATRSAQYSPRRTWVGALRSDGKIGEGTKDLGRTIVGHVVRNLEAPSRRFAIARASCERGCVTCSQESRVPPTLCYEFSSPEGQSSAEMRFEACFDPDIGQPFPILGIGADPIAPDGTFDPLNLSPSRPSPFTTVICDHDNLPVFPVDTQFFRCRRYQWLVTFPEGPYRFHAEEWFFVEGGFAGWFGWFTFELGGVIWDPCFAWITDPDWPFNPSPVEVRWSDRSPTSKGVTERVSPCGSDVLAALSESGPFMRRPLR